MVKQPSSKENYVPAIRWWIGLTILFYLIVAFVIPGKWMANSPILLASVFGVLSLIGCLGITVCALHIIPFKSKKAEGNMSIFLGLISILSFFLVGGSTIWRGVNWESHEFQHYGVRTTAIVIEHSIIPRLRAESFRSVAVSYTSQDGRSWTGWDDTVPKEIYEYREVGDTVYIMYSSRDPELFQILFTEQYLEELESQHEKKSQFDF